MNWEFHRIPRNFTEFHRIFTEFHGISRAVLTKFRIGENINNKEYISGYFQDYCELYPYKKENEFGYYSQLDSIYQKYKYFNLGELEVIGTNFYNRKLDYIQEAKEICMNKNKVIIIKTSELCNMIKHNTLLNFLEI